MIKFKVGQVWRQRNGDTFILAGINEGGYLEMSDGCSRQPDGRWDSSGKEHNYDLVELLSGTADTRTETWGTRYDSGKPRISLLPADAIRAAAEVATFGAGKYDDHNWMKGISYSRMMDSLLRHLTSFNSADSDIDSESGLHHVAHVAWNALALLHFILDRDTYGHLDDRPKKYRTDRSYTENGG